MSKKTKAKKKVGRPPAKPQIALNFVYSRFESNPGEKVSAKSIYQILKGGTIADIGLEQERYAASHMTTAKKLCLEQYGVHLLGDRLKGYYIQVYSDDAVKESLPDLFARRDAIEKKIVISVAAVGDKFKDPEVRDHFLNKYVPLAENIEIRRQLTAGNLETPSDAGEMYTRDSTAPF